MINQQFRFFFLIPSSSCSASLLFTLSNWIPSSCLGFLYISLTFPLHSLKFLAFQSLTSRHTITQIPSVLSRQQLRQLLRCCCGVDGEIIKIPERWFKFELTTITTDRHHPKVPSPIALYFASFVESAFTSTTDRRRSFQRAKPGATHREGHQQFIVKSVKKDFISPLVRLFQFFFLLNNLFKLN